MRRPNIRLGWVLVLIIIGGQVAAALYLRRIAEAPADVDRSGVVGAPTAVAARPRESGGSARGVRRPTIIPPGVSKNDPRAFRGYTLVASMSSTKTYLIDMEGRIVRSWESDCLPALGATLLEGGHLLRPGLFPGQSHPLSGPGAGGRVQEFDWDGRLVWDYRFEDARRLPHHDLTRLPNGNVLVLAWEEKTAEEAIAAGRKGLTGDGRFLPDCLIEIKPTGRKTGRVVWEWHVWDHLIQDHDPAKANYGDVAAHPERVDVNFGEAPIGHMMAQPDGMAKLRSIGYLGGSTGSKSPRLTPDWTHINAVAYHPRLDQIMLTVHAFSEVWIIDHSTTTAEAAGHQGGRGGKGGDLLYRWGNPRAHRAGTLDDQRLFFPHAAGWIPEGFPGAGHLLVFNNGARRPGGPYSTVDEVALPVDDRGHYPLEPGRAADSAIPVWSYTAPNRSDFFAMFLSGAQRLPNGNTLICSGMSGTIFEVTPENEVVWQYRCPVPSAPDAAGAGGFAGFGPPDGSSLFRAARYGPDDPALAGKELTPGKTIEELLPRKAAD